MIDFFSDFSTLIISKYKKTKEDFAGAREAGLEQSQLEGWKSGL